MDNNSTQLIEDYFEDINEEMLKSYESQPSFIVLHYILLATRIVKFILILGALFADILLIYAITKFKRLKTTVNGYIRHYAIFNISYFVTTPLVHMVHNCWGLGVEYANLLLNFLFAFALAFDWLIMIYKPELGEKLKNFYKYLTVPIYILGFSSLLLMCTFCYYDFVPEIYVILLITYILILLFILVLDFLNFIYKSSIRHTKLVYSLTIANIIVLCWLPMFIHSSLYLMQEYERIIDLVFAYTEFIPEWMSASVSIIIIIVLVRVNKYFKMAFAKLFKRSVRQYSNNIDNLDESEEHPGVGPNVFYNNTSTCVKI